MIGQTLRHRDKTNKLAIRRFEVFNLNLVGFLIISEAGEVRDIACWKENICRADYQTTEKGM